MEFLTRYMAIHNIIFPMFLTFRVNHKTMLQLMACKLSYGHGQQDEIHSSQSFSSHPLLAYRRTDVRAVEKDSEVESHIVINPGT